MSRPTDPYDWRSWAWNVIERLGESLTPRARLGLVALSEHGNAEGEARPAARTLAGRCGYTDTSPAGGKMLAELEAAGVIVAVGTYRRATIWQLQTSAATATPGVAVQAAATATPGVAVTPGPLLPHCYPSATPGVDEGEGEGTSRSTTPPLPAAVQREGEGAGSSNKNGNGRVGGAADSPTGYDLLAGAVAS